jgi:serine/threonine protein kinase
MTQILEKGTVIKDRYRVERFIGKGGQKSVYLAVDLNAEGEARYALKQMLGNTSRSSGVVKMQFFEQEAILLKGLRHPAIPKIYDYFVDQGKFYIIQEYIEGETLSNLLHRHAFSQEEALELAIQLADCLDYLHRIKPPIIYRDLKPQNVIVRENKPFFIDFSGALLPGIGDEAERTGVFTRGYAPPDARKRKKVDVTFDTYSLGVVLYEILTLFDVKSVSGKLPNIGKLRPDISIDIQEIINKAIYPGHFWQYQTMWEMKMELMDAYESKKKLAALEEKKEKNKFLQLFIWLHRLKTNTIQPLIALFSFLLAAILVSLPGIMHYFRPSVTLGFAGSTNFTCSLALYVLLVIVIWGRWFASVPFLSRIYKKFCSPVSWLGGHRTISLLIAINLIFLLGLNVYILYVGLR